METVEAQGRSLDEALAAAAEQLGVSPSELEYEVVAESKGLFGKGNVRVSAKVKAKKPARGKKPAATKEEPAAAIVEAEKPAEAPEEESEPEAAEATPEDADAIIALVEEILELAGLRANVKLKDIGGRYVNLDLDGLDVAHLVGKHGEVLNSFQYLMNVIISRRLANGVRCTLDGNNYRRRREEALTNMATELAKAVRERGEEAVLEALPAFERRIVHKALQELEGVTTYSEGEEPNRHVVIAPAD